MILLAAKSPGNSSKKKKKKFEFLTEPLAENTFSNKFITVFRKKW